MWIANNWKDYEVIDTSGGAALSAAKAGAQITHVDASKGMVNWAKEKLIFF